MYLVPIHLPIYKNGGELLVASDWAAALKLLRDSFDGRFGRVRFLGLSIPVEATDGSQLLERIDPSEEIDVTPSVHLRHRAREYWLRERARWQNDVRRYARDADVVHSGLNDVYRPFNYDAHMVAVAEGKTTVFVRDTDTVRQVQERVAGKGPGQAIAGWTYCRLFDHMMRKGVRSASLSLLKGRSLERRYARFARCPRVFHDTSYLSADIVLSSELNDRLVSLRSGREFKFVYCGRLVERKGVGDSIKIIHELDRRGMKVGLTIMGGGPERPRLERLVAELQVEHLVRFTGTVPYGRDLLVRLRGYDGLLFTPTIEDTPRMIFDAYAAGLPLFGYGIEYVRERVKEEGAGIALTRDDPNSAAVEIASLLDDRGEVIRLSRKAREAALYHAADEWYRRRAEWTIEAYERDQCNRGLGKITTT